MVVVAYYITLQLKILYFCFDNSIIEKREIIWSNWIIRSVLDETGTETKTHQYLSSKLLTQTQYTCNTEFAYRLIADISQFIQQHLKFSQFTKTKQHKFIKMDAV